MSEPRDVLIRHAGRRRVQGGAVSIGRAGRGRTECRHWSEGGRWIREKCIIDPSSSTVTWERGVLPAQAECVELRSRRSAFRRSVRPRRSAARRPRLPRRSARKSSGRPSWRRSSGRANTGRAQLDRRRRSSRARQLPAREIPLPEHARPVRRRDRRRPRGVRRGRGRDACCCRAVEARKGNGQRPHAGQAVHGAQACALAAGDAVRCDALKRGAAAAGQQRREEAGRRLAGPKGLHAVELAQATQSQQCRSAPGGRLVCVIRVLELFEW